VSSWDRSTDGKRALARTRTVPLGVAPETRRPQPGSPGVRTNRGEDTQWKRKIEPIPATSPKIHGAVVRCICRTLQLPGPESARNVIATWKREANERSPRSQNATMPTRRRSVTNGSRDVLRYLIVHALATERRGSLRAHAGLQPRRLVSGNGDGRPFVALNERMVLPMTEWSTVSYRVYGAAESSYVQDRIAFSYSRQDAVELMTPDGGVLRQYLYRRDYSLGGTATNKEHGFQSASLRWSHTSKC
jgi:hypothetical protein